MCLKFLNRWHCSTCLQGTCLSLYRQCCSNWMWFVTFYCESQVHWYDNYYRACITLYTMYVAFNMYRLNVFASQKWCTSFFFYISFSLKLKEEFTVLWFMNKRRCKKLMQRWGGIELVFKPVLVHVHVFVICMIFYWYSIVLQNCENFLDWCLACVEWISCTDVDFCQCTYNLAVLVCIWVHCMCCRLPLRVSGLFPNWNLVPRVSRRILTMCSKKIYHLVVLRHIARFFCVYLCFVFVRITLPTVSNKNNRYLKRINYFECMMILLLLF